MLIENEDRENMLIQKYRYVIYLVYYNYKDLLIWCYDCEKMIF